MSQIKSTSSLLRIGIVTTIVNVVISIVIITLTAENSHFTFAQIETVSVSVSLDRINSETNSEVQV